MDLSEWRCRKDAECSGESSPSSCLLQIRILPNRQVTVVTVSERDSAAEVLRKACDKAGLCTSRYFVALRNVNALKEYLIPEDSDLIQAQLRDWEVELRERLIYHVHLKRRENENLTLGLTVRAQRTQDQLNAYVTGVDEDGVAKRQGILPGDELIAINHRSVRRLSSQLVEQLLQEGQTLCLVLRTKRLSLPVWFEHISKATSRESINLQNCSALSDCAPSEEESLWLMDSDHLHRHKVKYRSQRSSLLMARGKQRYSLPIIHQSAVYACGFRESVSASSSPRHNNFSGASLTGVSGKRISSSEPGGFVSSIENGKSGATGKLGHSERLEKIIFELLETEKAYVEDLDRLKKQYLDPLKKKSFFPEEEADRLLSSVLAISRFQRSFLEELQEASDSGNASSPTSYSNHSHLRQALLRIGAAFLNASSRLKVYSCFCAAHFRVQKLLKQEYGNDALQQHLRSCNIENQHSSTFESYLIKPVQRILRYPLFLQQIKSLTSPNSAENIQISEALGKMEKVAEYINEMQRIYEEYGLVLSQVQSQNKDVTGKHLNLDISELLMFGEVCWLNWSDEGHRKRGSNIESLCFVFRTAILILPLIERHKGRKHKCLSINENVGLHKLIPIDEIEVNAGEFECTDNQFVWTLIHMGDARCREEKAYHFANRRLDVKQQFLRAIRKAGINMIKENDCQQNQLPLQRPPAEQMNERVDERVYVSSPDSGFPQPSVQPGNGRRPGSHYSSQSDAGYGSNSELHRKDVSPQQP